jgi:hypothetical protein
MNVSLGDSRVARRHRLQDEAVSRLRLLKGRVVVSFRSVPGHIARANLFDICYLPNTSIRIVLVMGPAWVQQADPLACFIGQ